MEDLAPPGRLQKSVTKGIRKILRTDHLPSLSPRIQLRPLVCTAEINLESDLSPMLAQRRNEVYLSEISANPHGQILEPVLESFSQTLIAFRRARDFK